MTIDEIKAWWKLETGKDIPSGWDVTEDMCLDYIMRDSYASGYNKSREMQLKKAKRYLIQALGDSLNSNNEDLVECFMKLMEE